MQNRGDANARAQTLLPAPYFHVVYTLPGSIADIAYQNEAVIYDILFKASAEATITIAADPKFQVVKEPIPRLDLKV